MKYLIFYDSNGKIYFSMTVDEAPAGLEKFTFSVPLDSQVIGIDLSDPDNPKPIVTEAKPVRDVEKELDDLYAALTELYETLS